MRVSVVVPVYRNRASLVELHERLSNVGAGRGWRLEQIYVDDQCPEGSREVLADIASSDPMAGVVALRKNSGQQTAVWIGCGYATGDVIAVMDADLQDPPERLPELVGALGSGIDVAFAVRARRYQSLGRTFTSRAFKKTVSKLTRLPEGYGMFLAVAADTLVRTARTESVRAYLPVSLARAARGIATVPIEREWRPSGSSSYRALGRVRLGVRAVATLCGLHRRSHASWHAEASPVEWRENVETWSRASSSSVE